MAKVSSIAIELKSSRGTFSSIAIELNIDGQRALTHPRIRRKSLSDMQDSYSVIVSGSKRSSPRDVCTRYKLVIVRNIPIFQQDNHAAYFFLKRIV